MLVLPPLCVGIVRIQYVLADRQRGGYAFAIVYQCAQSVWPNSICVSVVDDIAGDDATAGAYDEATAGNDAGSHW